MPVREGNKINPEEKNNLKEQRELKTINHDETQVSPEISPISTQITQLYP